MPVVLMFDGPSLGGFVCPATITSSQLWKMGQVSANDEIRFKRQTLGINLSEDTILQFLRQMWSKKYEKYASRPILISKKASLMSRCRPCWVIHICECDDKHKQYTRLSTIIGNISMQQLISETYWMSACRAQSQFRNHWLSPQLLIKPDCSCRGGILGESKIWPGDRIVEECSKGDKIC